MQPSVQAVQDEDARGGGAVSAASATARAATAPAIVSIVLAVALIAMFFVPYVSARPDYRAWLSGSYVSSLPVSGEDGLTMGDTRDLSLFEYTLIYQDWAQQGDDVLVASIISLNALPHVAFGAMACLTLLFALLRRPVPAIVFDVLTFGLACLVRWDFVLRGIVREETYAWGVASYGSIGIPVALLAASIWLLVVKMRAKRRTSRAS